MINSVLMNDVVVADNCVVQNSVLSSGVQCKERASVKDCQVGRHWTVMRFCMLDLTQSLPQFGPGFTIPIGADLKGEVLLARSKS